MAKSIIINKYGGPEVLELVDTKVKSPGSKHIRIKNLDFENQKLSFSVNEENKQKVIDMISTYGLKHELVEYEGSHKIIEKELEKIAAGL